MPTRPFADFVEQHRNAASVPELLSEERLCSAVARLALGVIVAEREGASRSRIQHERPGFTNAVRIRPSPSTAVRRGIPADRRAGVMTTRVDPAAPGARAEMVRAGQCPDRRVAREYLPEMHRDRRDAGPARCATPVPPLTHPLSTNTRRISRSHRIPA